MRSLGTAVLLAAILGAPDQVVAQRGKRDAALKDELKSYQSILRAKNNRKGERDHEAIAVMKKVIGRFDKLVEKDRRVVIKALSDTFRNARRTAKTDRVYRAAVQSLGKTGKLGASPLRKLFKNPRIAKGSGAERKSFHPLRANILRELGKCQDGRTWEFLLDIALRNAESDSFLAAAGEALGDFEKKDERLRKQIAHKLIREFSRIHGIANSRIGGVDPQDLQTPTFRRRFRTIKNPWNKSLQRLTKQELSDPNEWQRFWNKEKDRPWRVDSYRRKGRSK